MFCSRTLCGGAPCLISSASVRVRPFCSPTTRSRRLIVRMRSGARHAMPCSCRPKRQGRFRRWKVQLNRCVYPATQDRVPPCWFPATRDCTACWKCSNGKSAANICVCIRASAPCSSLPRGWAFRGRTRKSSPRMAEHFRKARCATPCGRIGRRFAFSTRRTILRGCGRA